MILYVIPVFLFLGYAFLMLRYRAGWRRQADFICPAGFRPRTKISVIIPARDEAGNIASCLESILNNNYPEALLEIIVMDDFSSDGTAEIASRVLGGRGKVLSLEDHLAAGERINAYKKKALGLAIGKAEGTLIVTTDADCIVPVNWLRDLAALHERHQARFIAAPVLFTRKKEKAVLFYFQCLDFMMMQGITAASAALRMGNMCNGANLAFDKATFSELGGYDAIDHIASGDDMLLMAKIQKVYPEDVYYLKSHEAIVRTAAQGSWADFFNQRIRWSSKAGRYEDKKLTWILGLVYLFNFSLPVLFIAGFWAPGAMFLLAGLLVVKTGVELFFLFPVAHFFGQSKALIFFPLLQPLHILYIIAAGFLGQAGTYRWKGRVVK
jgi:cellulose synthase/poly-beta-1,6-N-acetylglucosamine synthase-like glycosyltransferase